MDVLNILGKYTKSGEKASAPKRFGSLALLLGIPDKRVKYVHVAGTNGKGSVCEYISNALSRAGHKVGKFTSPYLVKINERISANDKLISDADLYRLCEKADKHANSGFSQFEILTAAALLYFAEQNCDYAVIETGIGGLLDCTNIITPEVSVITRIGLDHTDILGGTLAEIAAHKAGIIKEGVPVVADPLQDGEVFEVIAETALSKGSRLAVPDLSALSVANSDIYGSDFTYEGQAFRVNMGGEHQIYNALTAIEALRLLGVSGEHVKSGIEAARVKARLQIFSKNPLVILDGAHNPDGLRAARTAFSGVSEIGEKTVVVGMLKSKDYVNGLNELIMPNAAYVLTDGFSPDAVPAAELERLLRCYGAERICAVRETAKAVETAKTRGGAVLITGSLYLAGEVLK